MMMMVKVYAKLLEALFERLNVSCEKLLIKTIKLQRRYYDIQGGL